MLTAIARAPRPSARPPLKRGFPNVGLNLKINCRAPRSQQPGRTDLPSTRELKALSLARLNRRTQRAQVSRSKSEGTARRAPPPARRQEARGGVTRGQGAHGRDPRNGSYECLRRWRHKGCALY